MVIPAFWFWLLAVALMCVTFCAWWLWASVEYWKDHARRLERLIQRDRLMYWAGATPRDVGGATGDDIERDAREFATEMKLIRNGWTDEQ